MNMLSCWRSGPKLAKRAAVKSSCSSAMPSCYYGRLHRIADEREPNCKLGVLSGLLKRQGIDSEMANAYHADLGVKETV